MSSNLSLKQQVARLPKPTLERIMGRMTDDLARKLMLSWGFNARPDQLLPDEMNPSKVPGTPYHTWLILAGRGWGKTRVGGEAVNEEALSGRSGRIALVAETAADARDVLVEGDSGILRNAPPGRRPIYEPSKRKLTWPNGAVAHTYNATEPDQLRGPQHDFAWCDELAKWQYAQETWDMLQFGLRLGKHPRQIVTTTPRPIPVIRELLKDPYVYVTRGRTLDNSDNLAKSFLSKIVKKYEGTRLGRQELDAEVLDDMPGALWTREMIDRAFIRIEAIPPMERIVVAIDPSGIGSEDDDGDTIGIIVAGKNGDTAYVIEDVSTRGAPHVWARKAIDAFHRNDADCIVAEINYGGAMVVSTIRTVDEDVPVTTVHASRGKFLRAEPVSALYEQRRVRHIRAFPELEDQMTLLTRSGYQGVGSPDRLDALVWAITELMLGEPDSTGAVGTVRGLY